jgi:hypothetical protein
MAARKARRALSSINQLATVHELLNNAYVVKILTTFSDDDGT